MTLLLKVTGMPKSTYMYWQKRLVASSPRDDLETVIQSIYEENNQDYGHRRIGLALRKRGIVVNHKKVLKITRKLGILCTKYTRKSRKKYRAYKGKVGTIAKNKIRRRFQTPLYYQKLTTDITEFKVGADQKLYLSPIMDMGTGEIISYQMNERPNLAFVLETLEQALQIVLPQAPYRVTVHSDQGWHYQHKKWVSLLKKNKVYQSMSRKGNCLDNSPMENFFGLLKQEMYYGCVFQTYQELKQAIDTYIDYYNHRRIKLKLAGLSPVEYRLQASQEV
ncbi:Integrase core domain [Listeria newyorkensis]|nr:Integrase core domain [Listeria newyorkensis]SQC52231.1 Integrase core domain [Listeria newyorkensis]SQC56576.1 Integrase core domain [Listeria newyorkensis]SQC58856.1 Integrase core domain [Listeria newyorkensis]